MQDNQETNDIYTKKLCSESSFNLSALGLVSLFFVKFVVHSYLGNQQIISQSASSSNCLISPIPWIGFFYASDIDTHWH